MTEMKFSHRPPRSGPFGVEISTGFDREYERGTSEIRVGARRDGRVDVDVSRSVWAIYGKDKTGRTNTRTASTVLDAEQARNLIAALTDALSTIEEGNTI